MEENKSLKGISSALLHSVAMIIMLGDHAWATVLPASFQWMTWLGRIVFPIYAYLLVEGFYHTHSLKKYAGRLLVFALISEIPFDLVYSNAPIYPYHQNVLWTFLISLGIITLLDKVRQKKKWWLTLLVGVLLMVFAYVFGMVTMVDYYGPGILTVLGFYVFHGRKWWCYIGQAIFMYIININMLGGYYVPIEIGGHTFEVMQQSVAMLSLIPIWLYRGKKGYSAKWFQYFCYAFYPAHLLILYLIYWFMYR